ncbi:hypothetical protein [Agrobacterium larrymoorei]|uniref:Uncharacterized protein n=1 Tax=Agrobacterium larrymoorei TaxID=160699 RepID=A0AAF0KGA4_9HYPH|nr:hypothetical protein [Agrobacterium larrymoorei]WHA42957.1 hypothetical protein CFBP5477_016965 [Agrobacterium larrymoorei]
MPMMSQPPPLLSLSLNSFIRIYAMDPARQISEVLRRVQQSSGYDFYRTMNLAITARINSKSQDEIAYILNASSRPDEISYNKAAYDAFEKKFGSKKKLTTFEKKGSVKLADGKIVINVMPSFMVETSASMDVYHIWAIQNPKMDKSKANCACYVMEQAFKKSAPNYRYKLFDATSSKTYSGSSNTTGLAVSSVADNMAKWIENS